MSNSTPCVCSCDGHVGDECTFAGMCVEVVRGYTGHEALLAGVAHKLLHCCQPAAERHSVVLTRQCVTSRSRTRNTLTSSPLDLHSPFQ